jgi:hypothetical protein
MTFSGLPPLYLGRIHAPVYIVIFDIVPAHPLILDHTSETPTVTNYLRVSVRRYFSHPDHTKMKKVFPDFPGFWIFPVRHHFLLVFTVAYTSHHH